MKRHHPVIAIIASTLMWSMGLHAAESDNADKPKVEAKPAGEAREASKKSEPKCEYITGSRIRHNPKVNCDDGSPGLRVFTADELQSTGEADIGKALRTLDPRLR